MSLKLFYIHLLTFKLMQIVAPKVVQYKRMWFFSHKKSWRMTHV